MLYQTSVKLTYEEYKRFSKAVMKKNMRKVYISLIVLLFGAGLLRIVSPDSSLILFLIFFIIFYPIVLCFGQNRAIKKTYMSNELLKNTVETIDFYKNHFVSKTEKSESTVEYDKLYKIIETKTNFYLMIADNQGYIVSKANCSQELIDFIISLKK